MTTATSNSDTGLCSGPCPTGTRHGIPCVPMSAYWSCFYQRVVVSYPSGPVSCRLSGSGGSRGNDGVVIRFTSFSPVSCTALLADMLCWQCDLVLSPLLLHVISVCPGRVSLGGNAMVSSGDKQDSMTVLRGSGAADLRDASIPQVICVNFRRNCHLFLLLPHDLLRRVLSNAADW